MVSDWEYKTKRTTGTRNFAPGQKGIGPRPDLGKVALGAFKKSRFRYFARQYSGRHLSDGATTIRNIPELSSSPVQYTAVSRNENISSGRNVTVMILLRLSLFFALVANFALDTEGIPDYRRCPVGCNCTTSSSTCNTMDFPSFGIEILKLRIVEPKKPLSLGAGYFADRHLDTLDTIYVESATIDEIDPSAFDGLNQLVSVSFVNCTLPKIDPDTFVRATSLLILEFENTRLKQFDFIRSESISQLKISGANLDKITNNTFSYMVELVSINLANNNIEEIEAAAFDNLINLEDLNVTNNKITTLPSTLFATNEELVTLDLSGNPLETVDAIVAPNLEKLVLHDCMLQRFDGSQFSALGYIDLSRNKIVALQNTAFQNMLDLEYVDISNNFFNVLPTDLFANNSRLAKLILDHNDLQALPKFENEQTFETYYFSCNYCGLEALEPEAFESMPGLVVLNLSNNRMRRLRGEVFATVRSLVKLDLSYNLISAVDVDVFEKNTALTTLILAGNQIASLSPGVFTNNGVLQTLDLSNNMLTQIWKRPLNNRLDSIRILNVANNQLEAITKEELEVTKNLETLNINNNDLQCTDELRPAIEWLTNHSVAPVVLNTHEELINIDYSWTSASDNDFIWQDIIFDSCDDETDDYEFTEDLAIINRGIEVVESRTQERIRYSFMWPILVFILTALLVLFLVLNIILFILRRRGQLPRNINLSWRNGHGGFVYKPLTEDIAGSQCHMEKSTELPTVHRAGQ